MADDNKNIDYYNLSARYLSGEASDSEVSQLEQWVLASTENKSVFQNFKKAWILSGIQGDYQKIEVEKEWKTTAAKLFPQAKVVALPVKSKRKLSFFLGAAAAVALLIVASVWLFQYLNTPNYVEVVTQNEIEEGQLPDGSQISLNQYSKVRFDTKAQDTLRKVELIGDAFFDVERDSLRPFLITTQNIEIEVLGTSFYVDSRVDQPSIQVIVASGAVAVKAGTQEIVLAANETGIYDKASGALSKKQNDNTNYLAWKTGILDFEATNLETVIFDLNRRFHAQVTLANPALGTCEITATYENLSLEAIARVIERTLNIKADIDGKNIVFSGRACD